MLNEHLYRIDLETGLEQDSDAVVDQPVQKCEKIIYAICELVINGDGHKVYSRHEIQEAAFGDLIDEVEKKRNPVDQFSQAWTQSNNDVINRWKSVLMREHIPEKGVYYYSIKEDKYENVAELFQEISEN